MNTDVEVNLPAWRRLLNVADSTVRELARKKAPAAAAQERILAVVKSLDPKIDQLYEQHGPEADAAQRLLMEDLPEIEHALGLAIIDLGGVDFDGPTRECARRISPQYKGWFPIDGAYQPVSFRTLTTCLARVLECKGEERDEAAEQDIVKVVACFNSDLAAGRDGPETVRPVDEPVWPSALEILPLDRPIERSATLS